MKKLIIILLLACFIIIIFGQDIVNKEKNIETDAKLYIGGRLPVEKSISNTNSVNTDIDLIEEKILTRNKEINKKYFEKKDLEKEETKIEKRKPEQANINKRITMMEKIKVHTVKKGENLWTISHKYNIDIDTMIGANDITNMNMIREGDKLKILPIKGILYRINPGESLWLIANNFDITIDEIVVANNIGNPETVKPGKLLILPGAKPEFGYRERMSSKLMLPASARISSYYGIRWGKMHEGIDLAVNTGTKIKAAAAGKIVYSGWASGYGNTIIIEHQKGVRTLYAHNSTLIVHSGQYVNKGQVICLSGNSGHSTGPHLHFEVQINGRPVNPLSYIK